MTDTSKNPVGIYLLKPTKTHGSRYEVQLKRVVKDGKYIRWKTTSTPNINDTLKLEIAKKYVRWIIEIYPNLTKELKHEQYKEDQDVVNSFNINEKTCYNNTIFVRERDDPFKEAVVKKRSAGCKGSLLPQECGITEAMIPKYMYYKPESTGHGDSFVIERHPALIKEGKRNWQTTSSKNVSIDKKFMDALEKLTLLDKEI